MPYVQQPWTDNVTPVDAAHMSHIENGIAAVDANASTALVGKPSYGTTLPASPVDAQEAILVDSVTNPTYQWRFRFNAGSTSPYKWEFVGGPSCRRGHSGSAVLNTLPAVSGYYYDSGCVMSSPRAGDYQIDGWVSVDLVSGASTYFILSAFAGAGLAGPYRVDGPILTTGSPDTVQSGSGFW